MTGLKELTVVGAKSFANASARHRWQISSDYNVTLDCLERPFHKQASVALYYEDDEGHTATFTFGQMREASCRFANALRSLDVKRGDVVAVHTPQRPETAIIHMALYRLGAIGLPISKLFGPDAIQYRLENSSAKAILMEPETVGKLDGVREKVPTLKHVIVCGGKAAGLPGGGKVDGLDFDDLLAKGSDHFTPDRTPNAEDPLLLMYTSGTTGNPKGVLHVERYVLGHNGIDYSYNFLRDGDLYYSPADWAWAGGLLDGLLAIWPYGIPVLAYRSKARFDPEVTLRLLEKYGATRRTLSADGAQERCARSRSRARSIANLKLRCIVSGAEPVVAGARALGRRGAEGRVQPGLRPDRGELLHRHLWCHGALQARAARQAVPRSPRRRRRQRGQPGEARRHRRDRHRTRESGGDEGVLEEPGGDEGEVQGRVVRDRRHGLRGR